MMLSIFPFGHCLERCFSTVRISLSDINVSTKTFQRGGPTLLRLLPNPSVGFESTCI
jgi:hypothetical protein